MRTKLIVQRAAHGVAEAEDKLTKLKRQFLRAAAEEQNVLATLQRATRDSRVNRFDLDRLHRKALEAAGRVRGLEETANQARERVLGLMIKRDEALQFASQEFEASERERCTLVAQSLKTFVQIQRDHLVEQLSALDTFAGFLEPLAPDVRVDVA
ncbi:unnamed protein product [Phaeothamnion confervicola]